VSEKSHDWNDFMKKNHPSLMAVLSALFSVFFFAIPSQAQPQRLIEIESVRVGFPTSSSDLIKPGKWVPVNITVGPGLKDRVLTADFTGTLEIETKDGDGWTTRIVRQNIAVTRERNREMFQVLIKVAGSDDVVVTLKGKVGQTEVAHVFNYPRDRESNASIYRGELNMGDSLILGIGNVQGLLTVADESNQGSNNQRTLTRRVALPTRRQELPDQWYGYESVDAIVIATGKAWGNSLAQDLAKDSVRAAALEQWVLQGGHLIVSVASNAEKVGNPQDFPLERLLPMKVDRAGAIKAERLDGLRDFVTKGVPSAIRQKEGEVRAISAEYARLDPKPGLFALTAALVSDNVKRPLIVRSAYGLGKITLIGFDTDSEAFHNWDWKTDFWSATLEAKTAVGSNQRLNQWAQFQDDSSLDLANRIESFGDVPVISFAVVALFIGIYIILIGPVDYFILKKIFKRLEYTWFTFPTVVLAVSLAAYFGAYYLKGDKLRLNKVDLVEIDTAHQQVMGTTWLAIFSPRLQNYNVDIEPQGISSPAVTLSWLGRATMGARGIGQSQGGLFERLYDYNPNATGIRNLPIQVWSEKSLEARWSGTFDRAQPAIESKLQKDGLYLKGSLTYRLPQKLEGAKLFYSDKYWPLGTLDPGTTITIDPPRRESISSLNDQYFDGKFINSTSQQPDFAKPLNHLVFNTKAKNDGQVPVNEYLHYLNQGWRLKDDYQEAILMGTFRDEYGEAPSLNQGGILGTKIKLTNRDGSDLVNGTLRQATFLRVYLPLRAAEGQPQ
jgi:hypothetical protein